MNTRPSVSEIDKLLMKYLQNPPVRRFQSGGTAANPEADYFLPEDLDEGIPSGRPQTEYTPKSIPYTGNQRKLQATMAFLSKLMQAGQALSGATGAFQMPPNVDTNGDGVQDTYNPNIIMNFSDDLFL